MGTYGSSPGSTSSICSGFCSSQPVGTLPLQALYEARCTLAVNSFPFSLVVFVCCVHVQGYVCLQGGTAANGVPCGAGKYSSSANANLCVDCGEGTTAPKTVCTCHLVFQCQCKAHLMVTSVTA
jgi:hypothetical protein